MALDVTVGGAAAESYVSVADATTYLTARGVADSAFKSKATPDKEAALRKATAYIDNYYKFRGTKATDAAALQWPRYDVWAFSYYVDSDAIPQRIKDACCELALKAIAGELTPDIEPQKVVAESVGPLSVTYSENQRSSGRKQFDLVDMLLEPYLTGGRGAVPVVRA
jgi:hypothetical protein